MNCLMRTTGSGLNSPKVSTKSTAPPSSYHSNPQHLYGTKYLEEERAASGSKYRDSSTTKNPTGYRYESSTSKYSSPPTINIPRDEMFMNNGKLYALHDNQLYVYENKRWKPTTDFNY